jgi:hypothetical protein
MSERLAKAKEAIEKEVAAHKVRRGQERRVKLVFAKTMFVMYFMVRIFFSPSWCSSHNKIFWGVSLPCCIYDIVILPTTTTTTLFIHRLWCMPRLGVVTAKRLRNC